MFFILTKSRNRFKTIEIKGLNILWKVLIISRIHNFYCVFRSKGDFQLVALFQTLSWVAIVSQKILF